MGLAKRHSVCHTVGACYYNLERNVLFRGVCGHCEHCNVWLRKDNYTCKISILKDYHNMYSVFIPYMLIQE